MNKSIRRILIGTVLFLMGVMILLAILILTKTVCINKMFVSDDDIIGVDVSEYQDKIDMKRLSEQNIDFVYPESVKPDCFKMLETRMKSSTSSILSKMVFCTRLVQIQAPKF